MRIRVKHVTETSVAYSLDHAAFVASQLEKLATQNVHQLRGQFANLDFWLGEAEHAIRILDDYPKRFIQMRDAQLGWVYAHGTLVSGYCPFCGGPCDLGPSPPGAPKRIPSSKLDAARRSVRDAAYHFLRRLYRAKWIDDVRLRAACEQVGTSMDIEDLERH